MKKSILTFGTILLAVICVNAQSDTTKPSAATNTTTYTTYIDGYYRSDFAGLQSNNKTSFTNSNNSLQLGMASFKVDQTLGKFAGTVDLGVGKWATHIGYELLDAYSNRNYSMSYGFSYGPFFHTGLRADISLGGKTAMMIGVAEPTDITSSKVEGKMAIAQLSTASSDDKLKAFLNYQGGKDKSQFDVVLNAAITDQFGFNYDGTVCNLAGTNWSSNAVYFNYDPSTKVGFALRSELFNDSKGAAGVGTSIFQNTLSVNFHLNKFTIIPELRLDNANDKVFVNGTNVKSTGSGNFLIAAVYKF